MLKNDLRRYLKEASLLTSMTVPMALEVRIPFSLDFGRSGGCWLAICNFKSIFNNDAEALF